jgi:hypothetical protein
VGKGRAFESDRAKRSPWAPDPCAQAEADAARWLPAVADEYRLRALGVSDEDRILLRLTEDRLRQIATGATGSMDPEVVSLLQTVGLQLALWDCDPGRPGKGTWLALAADDFARLAGGPGA